jgi:hypothetical protein
MLMAVFSGLSFAYSLATPLFEAPDEMAHFRYVRRLARGEGLPELPVGKDGGAGNEGGQAPLYYALGAALTFWAFPSYTEELRLYPHSGPGVPSSPGTKNIWLHTPAEDFPGQGQFLAARLLRLYSGLLGLLAILATYATARQLWPERPWLAFAAASVLAFNPQFLFISAAINNDNLAAAAGALGVFLCVRWFCQRPSTLLALATGIVIGVGVMAKASVMPVLAILILVALWRSARFSTGKRQLATQATCLVGPAVAIAGWWFVRNWLLYGDPVALLKSAQAAGGRARGLFLPEVMADLDGLKRSFWGVFGAFNIAPSSSYYWIYDALTVLALIGLIILIIRLYRQNRRQEVAAILVLVAIVAATFASLLGWRSLVLAFQGRLLFPALSAISLLMVAGLSAFVAGRSGPWLATGLSAALLCQAVVAPALYIIPAYARPASLSYEQAARLSANPAARFGDQIELANLELPQRREVGASDIPLTLYWRAPRTVTTDYSLFIHFSTPDGQRWGQMDTYPGLGMYPTSHWRAGEVLRVNYRVPLAPDTPADATLLCAIGLYQVDNWQRLEAISSLWTLPDRQVVIGKIPAPEPIQTSPQVVYAGLISLGDFTMDNRMVAPGGRLGGILVWQAISPMEKDYTRFVQLVGPAEVLAQQDVQPLGGQYPTSRWDAGEVVRDRFELAVPADARLGEYTLVTGFYDLATGERLAVGAETYVELARVIVE